MPGSTRMGNMSSSRSDSKEMSKLRKAEQEYQKMLDSGKVKDLDKARQKIMKKYGVYPLGNTE